MLAPQTLELWKFHVYPKAVLKVSGYKPNLYIYNDIVMGRGWNDDDC